ncbi:uncharacterized protein LACBIDRAFT_307470 [Laccaria bicolor S238N-H82]|uniref:ubiquitinyl hydrolase 1 n=1 Tax=Laccaria bicolor (strain S238N-H82 / ATCC MYA-4686) TaxID=486041 RepID=B0DQ83_LACBS|nr:uncharacterized protein LACBIDRAFT_307470 [Laccaria bicolor S238N-H82]EDR03249.1 predicted protein [Laccaria bicolor S238N-H82]|eukprot:XP_001886045.1 predicted protein [Laccaria bicolor S238N-H82]
MASPHPPYSHPGPGGPSSYYQPSPPPSHHVYGSHSPGPGPNYQYQYPPPPPTHMGPHHPGGYPQPAPSRSTARGGSYSRAVHNYHGYHQQPHHQSYSNPHPIHAPHPQPPPPQHGPYSPHPTKYNQPYPPSYAYPHPPPQATYSPSWQSSQPLSPLPKQLTMPPPQNVLSGYSEPPPAQQSEPVAAIETPAVKTPKSAEISIEPIPAVEPEEHGKPPPAPSSPPPPSSSPVLPQSSSYSHVGTINTFDPLTSAAPPHPPTESPSNQPSSPPPASVTSMAPWAIWSRRPQDPSLAPSIIISPRARPPPEIVERALNLRTPPPSPPVSPLATTKKVLPPAVSTVEEEEAEKESLPEQSVDEEPVSTAAWSSETNSTVPSYAATETTYTPTVPGSPSTTNTSVSVAGTPAKEAGAKLAPETANGVVEEPDSKAPAALDAPLLVEEAAPSQATPEPAPAAATPAIPPPKKSWASLLRPASSTSTPTHTKNALPTSSVVGFSIPAEASSSPAGTSSTAPPSTITTQQQPVLKSELVALLTHNPTSTLSSARIRSRGLVNSGNMCFANSVLQILVYCAPFYQLFGELGRVMPEPVVGKESQSQKEQPLVAATVAFLKEFKGKDVVGAGGARNGSVGRKGKEREEREQLDDWDGDSFLPSYVYDAMKEKKRFDNMRGGHQEDAEEFLGFYLDTLEEELLSILHSVSPSRQKAAPAPVEEKEEAAPPEQDGWLEVGKRNRTVVTRTIKATESPITRIFGGKFRSTLRAPRQKDSVIVEDWRSLRLDIQREQIHTIQDALSYISHPQPVQVTHPSQPGITIDATQQVLIDALPPILILHIKRFCYDTTVGGVVKVGKQVLFGPELEIGPDLMSTTVRKSHPTKYKLFGALYHHGHSASGGHYTLDVLHPNRYPGATKSREGWVRIDDELVSDVRYEDVFGVSERDDSRCAYLLFYRRI